MTGSWLSRQRRELGPVTPDLPSQCRQRSTGPRIYYRDARSRVTMLWLGAQRDTAAASQ
ncbi:hypothetical protein KSZ_62640 [Dictyobacter formicarum]|uniref:Uncharacterized protein n=1 Tax=Dictyobacter formicarum TaxID=2778368 RepID=A0ABQ3VR07_9CHLR|nr:hypothetical protein KSZ_61440 [Dictyobacter formicarum]GHO88258.1 hypothetical protein KSZ_62640 [Dictyobacter formicarum]